MKTFSEFQIIGHVGKIYTVGSTLRITIAADYGKKDEDGRFVSKPFWNEVTIFKTARFDWIREHIGAGDLVIARGTTRQTKYEKDGETIYSVTLAADEFDLLAKKASAAA